MPRQPGFWSVDDRLRELSAQGDPLEKLQEIVDFELFRPVLDEALGDLREPADSRRLVEFWR